MDQELTKEEIDRRTRGLARRVMSMPPKPRVKTKAPQADQQKPEEPRNRPDS
jgi:hypothetical protein